MVCPSCGQRRGRRECPALRQSICGICCGTKRRIEINCPSGCPYLASAMEHPAAVVRRQQEQDVARLAPSIRQLTERQSQLFFLMHSAIARYKPGGFGRLADADVADAAAALAATLETSARGVIYDHAAAGPLAQSLVLELKRLLDEVRGNGARVFDHEVIVVLRAIELGARPTHGEEDSGGRTYLDLIARLLHGGPRSEESRPAAPEGRLIVP